MIPVFFLLLPESLVLDWAGPAEAFRIAGGFDLHFIGPVEAPRTSVGVSVTGIEPLPDRLPAGAWVVLVGMPGPRFDPKQPGAPQALRWLRTLAPGKDGLRVVTICAGALIAAHAGLLDGRRATTHHHHLEELRSVAPRCEVVANRVFVLDDEVASSAGVTTGIDPELSPFLAHRDHMHPVLHRVQDAVCAEPQSDWSVARMAEVGRTSPRHLTRLFVEHAGTAPLLYLRRIRIALAQAALASGQGVTRAAELAGFSSDTQLRRAWQRRPPVRQTLTCRALPFRPPELRGPVRSLGARTGPART
jgi:transcriptional regulator GlxA family with amidase domain